MSDNGLYTGWVPAGLSIGLDNEGHVPWVNGSASLWNISPTQTQDAILPTLSPGTISGTGATFGYTGDGLRAWKQNSAGVRTYYLYDGTDPVAEMDGSGSLIAVNTFGAERLVSRHTNTPDTSVFYTFDERGVKF